MRFRSVTPSALNFLRLVWSAVFAWLAVGFCVLWARSGSTADYARFELSAARLEASSVQGRTHWKWTRLTATSPRGGWDHRSERIKNPSTNGSPRFLWGWYSTDARAWAPHWFCAAMAFALSALPWIIGHFSIRTMLVVTAIVAAICAIAASY